MADRFVAVSLQAVLICPRSNVTATSNSCICVYFASLLSSFVEICYTICKETKSKQEVSYSLFCTCVAVLYCGVNEV